MQADLKKGRGMTRTVIQLHSGPVVASGNGDPPRDGIIMSPTLHISISGMSPESRPISMAFKPGYLDSHILH